MGVRTALGTTAARLRGMLLRQGLLMVAAGAIPGIAGARLTGRFLETLIDGAKPVRHNRVRWLGHVPRANRVSQHLGRLAADRHTGYRLPSCALISQQRSLLSSSDTEFGVEEANEMLPDEIIDDEGDG